MTPTLSLPAADAAETLAPLAEGAGGGLSAFAAPFTLFDVKDDPANLNFWRIFGKDYDDPAEMPRESRLQIAIADRYAAGECMRIGYGVFLFDGEKVVG